MNKMLFRIGTGRSKGTGISNKARLLDRAAKAGIAVPQSFIIRDEAILEALLLRFLDENIESGEISCPRPRPLAEWLNLPTFGYTVALRHAFGEEMQADEFETVLHINANDAHDLAQALCRVWSSAALLEGNFRRDVILMEMVDAHQSGTAYTETDYEADLVLIADQNQALPKLWGIERAASRHLTDWEQRLQKLLQAIRREFGSKNWEIEWADDGRTCYLIRLRSILHPPQREEAFVLLEPQPILPEVAGGFVSNLLASCSKDLYQHYRRFDKTLAENRMLIEVFQGRAYLNQSLLDDTLRHLGLKETNWRRMLIKTIHLVLPKLALSYLRRPPSPMISEYSSDSFAEMIEAARQLYSALLACELPLLRRSNHIEEIRQQLSELRKAMIKRARQLVEAVVLPDVETIWTMNIEELQSLDEGWLPDADFFDQKRAQIEALHDTLLPERVRRDRIAEGYHIQKIAQETLISPKMAST